MEQTLLSKSNNKPTLFSVLNGFLYTKQFLIVLGVIAVLFHTLNLTLIGLAIYVVFSCFTLLSSKDVTPFIPIAFFAVYLFNDFDVTTNVLFFVIVSPAVICFFIHIFLYPSKKTFILGKLFPPLVCVSIALFLGGIGSLYMEDYINGVVACFVFGPFLVIIYLFFRNNICPPKTYNLKDMLMTMIIISALIPSMEMMGPLIDIGFKDFCNHGDVLGWGSTNVVATMLVFSIPAVCYFMTKSKHFTPLFVLLVFCYFAIFASTSDGCLAISIAMAFPLLIYTFSFMRKDNFNKFVIFILFIFTIGLIALFFLVKNGFIQKIVDYVNKNLYNDTGRTKLYQEAVTLFKSNPIFGVSIGYSDKIASYKVGNLSFYNFHSVFFHILAMTGIIGVIAYSYLIYKRYSILMNNYSRFNVFITLCYSLMFCYALIDTAEFNILPCVIEVLLVLTVTELQNKKGEDELPLLYNVINFVD